jgi:methionyl-tRNA formyltransferase
LWFPEFWRIDFIQGLVEPGPPKFFLSLARHFHFAVRMTALRIIFMGAPDLSSAGLEALAHDAKFQIAAVVTHPDHPKGRGLKPQPSPVKSLALRLGLPVLQPEHARDEKFIAELRALRPDLIIVVAYGHILPPAILDLPRFGCLNTHTSLLPEYRGAAPIQWAIANGETETGVTIMKMDAGLDTGGILAQRRTPIRPADNSVTLHDRLARLGAELLAQTIPDYVAGKIQPMPQPAEGTNHAPKIKKEDGRIDWNQPAQTILNRLRAFTPWPGAFTFLKMESKQRLIKIWKVEVIEAACLAEVPGDGRPGEILSAGKDGIIVSCGRNALRILELQREGGRRMSAVEFLAGNPLNCGGRFK